jgi:hypothetical protein
MERGTPSASARHVIGLDRFVGCQILNVGRKAIDSGRIEMSSKPWDPRQFTSFSDDVGGCPGMNERPLIVIRSLWQASFPRFLTASLTISKLLPEYDTAPFLPPRFSNQILPTPRKYFHTSAYTMPFSHSS